MGVGVVRRNGWVGGDEAKKAVDVISSEVTTPKCMPIPSNPQMPKPSNPAMGKEERRALQLPADCYSSQESATTMYK